MSAPAREQGLHGLVAVQINLNLRRNNRTSCRRRSACYWHLGATGLSWAEFHCGAATTTAPWLFPWRRSSNCCAGRTVLARQLGSTVQKFEPVRSGSRRFGSQVSACGIKRPSSATNPVHAQCVCDARPSRWGSDPPLHPLLLCQGPFPMWSRALTAFAPCVLR